MAETLSDVIDEWFTRPRVVLDPEYLFEPGFTAADIISLAEKLREQSYEPAGWIVPLKLVVPTRLLFALGAPGKRARLRHIHRLYRARRR